MKEYIEKDAAIEFVKSLIDTMSVCTSIDECLGMKSMKSRALGALHDVPAADVVPWEWLELYADYFWAGVSMPEFVREAKMFYESSNKAMQGGVIDG